MHSQRKLQVSLDKRNPQSSVPVVFCNEIQHKPCNIARDSPTAIYHHQSELHLTDLYLKCQSLAIGPRDAFFIANDLSFDLKNMAILAIQMYGAASSILPTISNAKAKIFGKHNLLIRSIIFQPQTNNLSKQIRLLTCPNNRVQLAT